MTAIRFTAGFWGRGTPSSTNKWAAPHLLVPPGTRSGILTIPDSMAQLTSCAAVEVAKQQRGGILYPATIRKPSMNGSPELVRSPNFWIGWMWSVPLRSDPENGCRTSVPAVWDALLVGWCC